MFFRYFLLFCCLWCIFLIECVVEIGLGWVFEQEVIKVGFLDDLVKDYWVDNGYCCDDQ